MGRDLPRSIPLRFRASKLATSLPGYPWAGSFARQLGRTMMGVILALTLSMSRLIAMPQDGVVVEGSAQIVAKSPTQVEIVQGSNSAIIDWGSFSIGAGESVVFVQSSALAKISIAILAAKHRLLTAN